MNHTQSHPLSFFLKKSFKISILSLIFYSTTAQSTLAQTVSATNGNTSYIEDEVNETPVIIDSAISISSFGSFDGGTLKVHYLDWGYDSYTAVTAGDPTGTEDQLTVRNQGTGAGQIGTTTDSGAGVVRISYEGTEIGTHDISGSESGVDGVPLVITLDSDADQDSVIALARNIQYQNVSDNATQYRIIQFTFTDKAGGTASNSRSILNFTDSNAGDAPEISGWDSVSFSEADAENFQVIDSSLVFTDPDRVDRDGMKHFRGFIKVRYDSSDSVNYTSDDDGDYIFFENNGTTKASGVFSVNSTSNPTSVYYGTSGTAVFAITKKGQAGDPFEFTVSNDTDESVVDKFLESLTFKNTSASPDATREIFIWADDADRSASPDTTTSNITITIVPSNPVVQSVSVPSDDTYVTGDDLDFTINFDKNITVDTTSGTPYLQITVGSTTRQATYVSGSGSQNIVFRYTLVADEEDTDGLAVNSLVANGATFKNGSKDATLTLNSIASTSNVLVDAVRPTVSSVEITDGVYKKNNYLYIKPTFTENLTVSTSGGTPYIEVTLTTGTIQVPYISRSGAIATFRYQIQAEDNDLDGITVASSITLNGGSMTGPLGNPVDLALGSHDTSEVIVDANPPEITAIAAPADGSYHPGDKLEFTVTLDQPSRTNGSKVYIQLTIGTKTINAEYEDNVNYVTEAKFSYTVGTSFDLYDTDGIEIIAESDGTYEYAGYFEDENDNTDNDQKLPTPPNLENVLVDTKPAYITALTAPSSGTYATGDLLRFVATFDEPVTAQTDGAYIRLNVGASSTIVAWNYVLDDDGNKDFQISDNGLEVTFTWEVPGSSSYNDTDGLTFKAQSDGNYEYAGTFYDADNLSDSEKDLPDSLPDVSEIYIDTIKPSVTSVSAPAGDTYITGEHLDFTLNFNEAVTVDTTGGTPSVDLTIGSTTESIEYLSGSGSQNLTFRYTVATGDFDNNGVSLSSTLNFNSGTMKDAAGNDVNTSLSGKESTSDVDVDAKGPTVTSVEAPDNDTYGAGEDLDFTLNFDEVVTVNTTNGKPTFGLTVGSASKTAEYLSGSGSTELIFRYTVDSGDNDSDGIAVVSSPISLNSGTMKDSLGNNADLTLNSIESTSSVDVDGVAATVSSVELPDSSSIYKKNNYLYIKPTFTENLTVDTSGGTPYIEITLTSGTVQVPYISRSGAVATFRYRIADEDEDLDGISMATSITLNGGTITDAAGTTVSLALGSHDVSDVIIDANPPEITAIAAPADGSYHPGDKLEFTATLDQPSRTNGNKVYIQLQIGSKTINAEYEDNVNYVTEAKFSYTVGTSLDLYDTDGIEIIAESDGTYEYAGYFEDENDNTDNDQKLPTPPNLENVLVDTKPAYITALTAPASGTYTAGDVLEFVATFDEPVTAQTDGAYIRLNVGASSTIVAWNYVLDDDGNKDFQISDDGLEVTFRWEIPDSSSYNDTDGLTFKAQSDGNYEYAGLFYDADNLSDSEKDLPDSLPDVSEIYIDTIKPEVSSVSVPAGDTYIEGENLDFTVNFDEAVTVDITGGKPSFDIVIGSTTEQAEYQSGSGSQNIVFRYTITTGDFDNDGISVGSSIDFNSGSMTDAAGNTIENNLRTVGSTSEVDVDATGPSVSSVSAPSNDTYGEGDDLDFTVNFDEAVTVDTTGGKPTLTLTVGSDSKAAEYESGSGTTSLIFRYTVGSGDSDSDGIEIVNTPIVLNSGTMKDTHGNDANLALVSIDSTPNVFVDGVAATLSSIELPDSSSVYQENDYLYIKPTFNENLTVDTSGGTPYIEMTLTSGTIQVPYISKSGAIATFRYQIQEGDNDLDGISIATSITLNGGSMTDEAGTAISLTLGSHDTSDVIVDAKAPSITAFTNPADGSYHPGDKLEFTITLDQPSRTNGSSAYIQLKIGSRTVNAEYEDNVNYATEAKFSYTVEKEFDLYDTDGIEILPQGDGSYKHAGAFEDQNGNTNDSSFPNPASLENVLVDTKPAYITALTAPANGTYGVGDNLDFVATFDEVVTPYPDGAYIRFTAGDSLATATNYVTDDDGNKTFLISDDNLKVTFRWTVTEGSFYTDTDGIVFEAQSDGSYKYYGFFEDADEMLDSARLLPDPMPNVSGVHIDTTPPKVSSVSVPADKTYVAGETLDFTLNFDEVITVDTTGGKPSFDIAVGSNAKKVEYESGSGSSNLVFRYTIVDGDLDEDGITFESRISLNGGTLKDAAGNNTEEELNGVPSTSGVKVDAKIPTISSVDLPSDTTHLVGSDLDFRFNFSEAVFVNTSGDKPSLSLTIGSDSKIATYHDGHETTTLIFRYTVVDGDFDEDGITINSLALNGGFIRDAADNSADRSFSAPSAENVKVDATAPNVTRVNVPTNGTYATGDELAFVIDFDKDTFVNITDGKPSLKIRIGSTIRDAEYQSGDTTPNLRFGYTIVEDEEDTDGIEITELSLNGGTLKSSGGQGARLTLKDVGDTTEVLVDAIGPSVSEVALPAGRLHKKGEVLQIKPTFTENITVTGSPYIQVTFDSGTVNFAYTSTSENELIFEYMTATGDADLDGIEVPESIELSGGSIKGPLGNNAKLALGDISGSGITIDAKAPEITGVSIPNRLMIEGEVVTIQISVATDADTYTLEPSSITAFALGDLQKIDDSTYEASFTITSSGADIDAASEVPVSIVLKDESGNKNEAYVTAVTQDSDRIDTNNDSTLLGDVNHIEFQENALNTAAAILDADVHVEDDDSLNHKDGYLKISYAEGKTSADHLSIRNEGSSAGQIGFSEGNVTYGGLLIGTAPTSGTDSGAEGNDLKVSFTTENATSEAIEALIQNILYQNTSHNPANLRRLSLVINDGDGDSGEGDSSVGTSLDVTITLDNDPPVNTELPAITGDLRVESMLSASIGTWDDSFDGASTLTYTYQWQRSASSDGSSPEAITAATAATYTQTLDDLYQYLSVKVTATDDGVGAGGNQSVTVETAWTEVILPALGSIEAVNRYAATDDAADLSIEELVKAGVLDLSSGNLAAYQTIIAKTSGEAADTTEELQALIAQANDAVNVIRDYGKTAEEESGDASGMTVSELEAAGIQDVIATNLAAYQDIIASQDSSEINSSENIQALIDAFNNEKLAVIQAYAAGDSEPAFMTLLELQEAGAVGISEANLIGYQAIIESITAEDIPSIESLQEVMDEVHQRLDTIASYADADDVSELTLENLIELGLSNVHEENLGSYQYVIENLDGVNVDSVTELQDLIDQTNEAIATLQSYAENDNAGELDMELLAKAGLRAPVEGNLSAYKAMLASEDPEDAATGNALQALIDDINQRVQSISDYAAETPDVDAPTVDDLWILGITDVIASNLSHYQAAFIAADASEVDTATEIQAFVEEINLRKNTIIREYARLNDATDLTITELEEAGVDGALEENLAAYRVLIAQAAEGDVQTPEAIQALIDEVHGNLLMVSNAAEAGDASGIEFDFLTALGLEDLILGNLETYRFWIANTDPARLTTVEDLQDLIEDANDVVEDFIADHVAVENLGLDLRLLKDLGATDINLDNQAGYEAALKNADIADAITTSDLQSLIDDVHSQIAVITDYAEKNDASALTVDMLVALGITDVLPEKISLYQESIAQADAADAESTLSIQALIAATDVAAPEFVETPELINITSTQMNLNVQLNENATIFYMVVPSEATTPTIEELQSGELAEGVELIASGQQALTTGEINITGLSSKAKYDVYFIAQDQESRPNLQGELSKIHVVIPGIFVSELTGSTKENGTQATFTIQLATKPSDDVHMEISSSQPTEGTPKVDRITFTPDNWDGLQTIIIEGKDDHVVDLDQTYFIQFDSVTSTDAAYAELSLSPIEVVNHDDDIPGILIDDLSGNTSEDGDMLTFNVRLNSQPISKVIIPVSSSDTSEGIVSHSQLEFTAANWSGLQEVIVTGIDDDNFDKDQGYNVVFGDALSEDNNYVGMKSEPLSLKNLDNDSANFIISPVVGTINESGSIATFDIRLQTKPTADVTLALTSSNTAEGAVASEPLVFTELNWDANQTVSITGVNDDVSDGNQSFFIQFSEADSADSDYDGIKPSDIEVVNHDDDTASFVVTQIQPKLREDGDYGFFSVRLQTQPTGNVTLPFYSSNTAEGTLHRSEIVFTPTNWKAFNTITVQPVDDEVSDGDQSFFITFESSSSNDPNYDGKTLDQIEMTNYDNDIAGFIVSEELEGRVTEDGGFATFSIRLRSKPTEEVTIPLSLSNDSEATLSSTNLSFDAVNWRSPQEVTVTGKDDDVKDGDQRFLVNFSEAISKDTNYAGLFPASLEGNNLDNDSSGIIVETPSKNVTEDGTLESFRVKLRSQPSEDVTVKFSIPTEDQAEAELTISSISFGSNDWNSWKSVPVRGVDDFVEDGDQEFQVVFEASESEDSDYNGLSLDPIKMINEDNDIAGFTISSIDPYVHEDGTTQSLFVSLQTQPLADDGSETTVSIDISSSNTAEGTVLPETIKFTSQNWRAKHRIIVQGVDDNVSDGDQSFHIRFGLSESADSKYDGFFPSPIEMTNVDNDIAGVIVEGSDYTTNESGGFVEFTARLRSEPTEEVTIPLSISNPLEAKVYPSELVFSPLNWGAIQTIRVTGLDDIPIDGDQGYQLIFGSATSADSKYSGFDADDLSFINEDNDSAGFFVSEMEEPVNEDGFSSVFKVRLRTPPSHDVRIPLRSSDAGEGYPLVGSLIFTPKNWDGDQEVEVVGEDDEAKDGDQPFRIILGAAISDDPLYSGKQPGDVDVVNEDNDDVGVVIGSISNDVSEREATVFEVSEEEEKAFFYIRLRSEPTANVEIELFSTDESEGALSKTTFDFDRNNWRGRQSFHVKGINDDISDGNQLFFIRMKPASSEDLLYNGLLGDELDLMNRDNDEAGILVSEASRETREDGREATFTLRLKSLPSAPVIVTMTSSDPSEGIVVSDTIELTASNWNADQKVRVKGVDDTDADGSQPYEIQFSITSADEDYEALTPAPVNIRNLDDESAGFIVSRISGNTGEDGRSANFGVRLSAAPTGKVRIGIGSSNSKEGIPFPAFLTFTPLNWNARQKVTVVGKDDDDAALPRRRYESQSEAARLLRLYLEEDSADDPSLDGDQSYQIVMSSAVSDDDVYDGMVPRRVRVVNEDDDTAGFLVNAIEGETSEGGETFDLTIQLRTQPSDDVIVQVVSTQPNEGAVSKDTLTFTRDNWSAPQTVTVAGVDDEFSDGAQGYEIIINTQESNDLAYANVEAKAIPFINQDNDTAGFIVSDLVGTIREDGTSASFGVRLRGEPSSDVTVTLTPSVTDEIEMSTNVLVFTADNWTAEQFVTLTGLDDEIADSNQVVMIQFSEVRSADPDYSDLPVAPIEVSNEDDDTAGFIVSEATGELREDGSAASFSVVLKTEPLAEVRMPITTDKSDEVQLSSSELTFTASNWNEPQTVTVEGVDDTIPDGDQSLSIFLGIGTESDDENYRQYAGTIKLTNIDDDSPGFFITDISENTTEDGSVSTMTFQLKTTPAAPVTITALSSNTAEVTLDAEQLEFNSDNWTQPQILTLQGVDDNVTDGNQRVTISFIVASEDEDYTGFVLQSQTLFNEDNDQYGFVFNILETEALEGSEVSVASMKLKSAPSEAVSVALSSSDVTALSLVNETLSFTSENWHQEQYITLSSENNLNAGPDRTMSVSMADSVSEDANYAGHSFESFEVVRLDAGEAPVEVSEETEINTVVLEEDPPNTNWEVRSGATSITFPDEGSETQQNADGSIQSITVTDGLSGHVKTVTHPDGTANVTIDRLSPNNAMTQTKVNAPTGSEVSVTDDGSTEISVSGSLISMSATISPNGSSSNVVSLPGSNGPILTQMNLPQGSITSMLSMEEINNAPFLGELDIMTTQYFPEAETFTDAQKVTLRIKGDGRILAEVDIDETSESAAAQSSVELPANSTLNVTHTAAVLSEVHTVTTTAGNKVKVQTSINYEGATEVLVSYEEGSELGKQQFFLPKATADSQTIVTTDTQGIPQVQVITPVDSIQEISVSEEEPTFHHRNSLYLGRSPQTGSAVYLSSLNRDTLLQINRAYDDSITIVKVLKGVAKLYRNDTWNDLEIGQEIRVKNQAVEIPMASGKNLLSLARTNDLSPADLEIRFQKAHSVWLWSLQDNDWEGFSADYTTSVNMLNQAEVSPITDSITETTGLWVSSGSQTSLLVHDEDQGGLLERSEFSDLSNGWNLVSVYGSGEVRVQELKQRIEQQLLASSGMIQSMWRLHNGLRQAYASHPEQASDIESSDQVSPLSLEEVLQPGESIWIQIRGSEEEEEQENLEFPPGFNAQ